MRTWLFLLLLLPLKPAISQGVPERVAGLPTNELYDLLVDKKGYLWIAHSLGVSRYDGLSFTNFSPPGQTNLRTTDLVEDPMGRIWFHNFSGQVFYIDEGKIHQLEQYDFRSENQNPKMVLCGNELLVSSYRGLFVCNTLDLSTRFFPFAESFLTALVSIAVVADRAVVYNSHHWYIYQQGALVRAGTQQTFPLPANNFIALQPGAFNDTLFLAANPSGVLYKLKLQGNELRFLSKTDYHDFINGVTVGQSPWLHTRNRSVNLQDGTVMRQADVMDMVRSPDGSTWYGSRREGLQVVDRPSLWKKVRFRVDRDDYIRSLNGNAGYFFVGTQVGTLFRFHSDSVQADWKQELFNGLGSIDYIRYLNNNLFVVGSSTDTYIVNAGEKRIVSRMPVGPVLDADYDGKGFYVATAEGLYAVRDRSGTLSKEKWLAQKRQEFPFFQWDDSSELHLLVPRRTTSVRFDPVCHAVYAATKNGLFEINRKGIWPVVVNGNILAASAVSYRKPKLYIATINDGLWIMENGRTQRLPSAGALASNALIRTKITDSHLWLFEKNGVQVLDIRTDQLLQNLDLPKVDGANVLDVAEKDGFGYLVTLDGVYRVPLYATLAKQNPAGFLDYVIVNGRDTLSRGGIRLSHQQNDVQFLFSAPEFYDPASVSFRYRLHGADDEWRVTAPGERMIRYSALTPGSYEFALYAVSSNGMRQPVVTRFPFVVRKPWWQTAWFIVAVNLVMIALVYFFIQNRITQKLRLELMRRTISHDLHDDIGATLSSLNFYIDLAQSEKQNADYFRHIRENVAQVVNNLDDLVWSINPQNDTTGQFVDRMKDYVMPLLMAAGIQCHFSVDPRLTEVKLNLLTKRNLYLLFKEMVNNVVKHAGSHHCTIELSCHRGVFAMSVADDGRGFDPEAVSPRRNGLATMRERTRRLKGNLEIRSEPGGGSKLTVSVPV